MQTPPGHILARNQCCLFKSATLVLGARYYSLQCRFLSINRTGAERLLTFGIALSMTPEAMGQMLTRQGMG